MGLQEGIGCVFQCDVGWDGGFFLVLFGVFVLDVVVELGIVGFDFGCEFEVGEGVFVGVIYLGIVWQVVEFGQ